MNLLAALDKQLAEHPNFTLEQKCRFLYIRVCQLFSYDRRYSFYTEREIQRGKAEAERYNYNLEDISDHRLIDISYARIMEILMRELLNVRAKIYSRKSGSNYIEFYDGSELVRADALNMYYNDIAHVKMKIGTLGYSSIEYNKDFYNKLKENDQIIKYIKTDYMDNIIINHGLELYNKRINETEQRKLTSISDNLLFTRLEVIGSLFHLFRLHDFEDADACINYLLRHLLGANYGDITTIPLYSDKNKLYWDFVNLYYMNIDSDKDKIYFALDKDKDGFDFKQITKEDVKNYCSQYVKKR